MSIDLSSGLPERVIDQLKAGEQWKVIGKLTMDDSDALADLSPMSAKMDFIDADTGAKLHSLDNDNGILLKDGSGLHNYEITLTSAETMKFNAASKVISDFVLVVNSGVAYPVFNLMLSIERNQTAWQQQ